MPKGRRGSFTNWVGPAINAGVAALKRRHSTGQGKIPFKVIKGVASVVANTRRRSFTKTLRKKKKMFFKGRRVGRHSSVSYFAKKKRMPRGLWQTLRGVGKKLDQYTGKVTITGNTGQQTVAEIGLLKGNKLFDLWTKYSGGAIVNAQATQVTYLRYMKAKIEFTNTTNTVTRFSIYDIVPRNDLDAALQTTTATPSLTWDLGLADESGGTTGRNNRWHTSPFRSRKFCEVWKVLKVTNIDLDPGASHIHYVKLVLNKKIPGYRLVEMGNDASNKTYEARLRGWNHEVMIVGNGVPEIIEEGNDTTPSAASFCINYEVESCCQAITDNSTTISMATSSFTVGAENTLEVINPVSGDKSVGMDTTVD